MRWQCVGGAAALVAAVTWAMPVAGQRVVADSGQRVRVRAEGLPRGWSEAVMQGVVGDTVVVTLARDGSTRRLAATGIGEIQLWRGRRSRALQGALVGGAIGGVSLAISCAAQDCDESRAVMFAMGAGAGGAVGALVGAAIRSDRWQSIEPAALVAPAPRGVVIGLRVRL